MLEYHDAKVRVRYAETDQMGVVYHANFLIWFEVGRVELMRALGVEYKEMEKEDDCRIVVADAHCRYHDSARYDEELQLTTRVQRQTHVRIDHTYELKRGDALLAEAATTIACVGRDGKVTQIPEFLTRA